MVKGNWERRAERAALEREAARERKALKNRIKCPPVEKIVSQLIQGEKYDTPDLTILSVWVEDLTSDKKLCCQWFRVGDCSTKRCHYSHEITLFGIQNISLPSLPSSSSPSLPSSSSSSCHDSNQVLSHEPSVSLVSLHNLSPEQYPLVRLITIHNFCIYDWARSNVWLDWSRIRIQDINSRKNLKSITEESYHPSHPPEEDLSPLEENIPDAILKDLSSINLTNTTTHSNSSDLILLLPPSLLSWIFQYCPLMEICSLSICSKQLHHLIRKDSSIRSRRKEYLQSITPLLMKQKKEEKKKKLKNSHVKKQDKKDGFARGGNG